MKNSNSDIKMALTIEKGKVTWAGVDFHSGIGNKASGNYKESGGQVCHCAGIHFPKIFDTILRRVPPRDISIFEHFCDSG